MSEHDDPSLQYDKSWEVIQQFSDLKKCMIQFAFENFGQKTMSLEIIENIMDEIRRDRKVRMVLADENIEEYITIDLNNLPPEEEQTLFMKYVVRSRDAYKLLFR